MKNISILIPIILFCLNTIGQPRNINTSAAVGTIPGSLSVGSSGSAIYTIPIEVPTGINGMTPELGFVYNSRGGNGIMGPGWSIGGISAVTRTPGTYYYNEYPSPVNFADDQLTIDGKKLIKVSQTLNEYRFEEDDITKIVKQSMKSGRSDGVKFVAYTKDGLIKTYGGSDESHLTYNYETNPALMYYLSKIEDRFGNYIEYNYNQNTTEGTIYLSSIKYTLHEGDGQEITNPDFKILFNYEDMDNKDHQTALFTKGVTNTELYKYKIDKRLTSLEIYYSNQLQRTYKIEYNEGGDLNQQVVEKISLSTPNEFYNSTNFNWIYDLSVGGADVTLDSEWSDDPSDFPEIKLHPGDFNGDGLDDILVIKSSRSQSFMNLYLNNKNGEFGNVASQTLAKIGSSNSVITSDFNGDGNMDILVRTVANGIKLFEIKTNNNQVEFVLQPHPIPFTTEYQEVYGGDLNGDGLSDCIVYSEGEIKYYQGDIDNMLRASNIGAVGIGSTKNIYLGDFDGEGKSEIIIFNQNDLTAYIIELNTYNTAFMQHYVDLSVDNKSSNSQILKEHFFRAGTELLVADMNKDGKSDILSSNKYSNSVTTFFCYGYDFVEKQTVSIEHDNISASDLNGDGTPDLIVYNENTGVYHHSGKLNGILIHRDGLTLGKSSGFGIDGQSEPVFTLGAFNFGNFTGTGKNDLVCSYVSSPDWYDFGLYIDICYAGSKSLNRIVQITDGLGNSKKIHYEALPASLNYSSELTNIEPPLKKTSPSIFLVTMVEQDNGKGEYFLPTEYQYKNAVSHRLGKGFLGFKELNVKNAIQNSYTKSIYDIYTGDNNDLFFHLYNSLSEQYTLSSGEPDILMSSITNEFSHVSEVESPIKYFPYVKSSIIKQYRLHDGELFRSTEIDLSEPDRYGNHSEIITIKKQFNGIFGVEHHKNIREFEFWNDESNWILGRQIEYITKNELISNSSLPISEKRSIYDYYDNPSLNNYGMLQEEIREPGNQNAISVSYVYDDYGNTISTAKDSYNNPSSETQRTTEYVFSSEFNYRFNTSTSNALYFETENQHNEVWGWITSYTDPNDFVYITSYNDFGQMESQSFPDGTSESITTSWVDPTNTDNPEDAIYYIEETLDGSSPVRTYYDNLGRDLRTVTVGMHGTYIFTDKDYNAGNGKLASISKPYFKGSEKLITSYIYDEINRVVETILPGERRINYNYLGPTMIITNPDDQKQLIWTNLEDNILLKVESYMNAPEETSSFYSYDADGNIISSEIHGENNTTTSCEYDIFGNLTMIIDPAIGKKDYKYNCFGEIIQVKHDDVVEANNITYDKLGRLKNMVEPGFGEIDYQYDNTYLGAVDAIGFVDSESSNFYLSLFGYDPYGRNNEISEIINHDGISNTFVTSNTYDQYGRPERLIYPSNFSVINVYNEHGYLTKVVNETDGQSFWELGDLNSYGQTLSSLYGNNVISINDYYNETGFLKQRKDLKLSKSSGKDIGTIISDMQYEWDNIGNLTKRSKLNEYGAVSLTESFLYDQLNRLTNVNLNNGESVVNVDYDDLGRILSKRSENSAFHVADNYVYDESGTNPYKLLSIDNTPAFYNPIDQVIEYTIFDKVKSISQFTPDNVVTSELNIFYGGNHQRKVQVINDYENNAEETKMYVGGLYEQITNDEGSEYVHYISSPDGLIAIYTKKDDETEKTNYVHKDHLGSIIALSDESGETVQEYSYDSWGLRRDPETWIPYNDVQIVDTDRGFTGHEHLDLFAMVNMNGRIYDPVIGYFSTPDPSIGVPTSPNEFNLYSYVRNNPLSYVDPTGYKEIEIADIGGTNIFINIEAFNIGMELLLGLTDNIEFTTGLSNGGFEGSITKKGGDDYPPVNNTRDKRRYFSFKEIIKWFSSIGDGSNTTVFTGPANIEGADNEDWENKLSDHDPVPGNIDQVGVDQNGGDGSFGDAATLAAVALAPGWNAAFGEPTFWGEVAMGVSTLSYATYLYLNSNSNYPGPWYTDRPSNYIPAPLNGPNNRNYFPQGNGNDFIKWTIRIGGASVLGKKLYDGFNLQPNFIPADNTNFVNPTPPPMPPFYTPIPNPNRP